MISQARWGCWETNSSTIHQLVIRMKDPKPVVNPDQKLSFRLVNIYNIDNISYEKRADAQTKLDIVVQAILHNEDMYSGADYLYPIFILLEHLQKSGVSIDIDVDSFSEYKSGGIASDLCDYIVETLKTDPTIIINLILDPDSMIVSDNNNYRDDSQYLVNKNDPKYEGFKIVEGEY